MFAAGKTSGGAAGGGSTTDPQFNYVTMLLHGDGTNGAQNNTFLDSSTNNFTITRAGTPTQGSFSPYGSNWSNYFGVPSDASYLSSPANTALNMGTGNWTIECWVYISSRTVNYPLIFGNNNGSYSTGALAITNSNNDSPSYYDKFFLAFYDVGTFVASGPTNSINTWYHLAVVRNGTNISMYRNGSSVISTTISAGITFDWGKLGTRIGGGNWDGAQSYFNGNISNLRVVKGTAVYTTDFTPSTTPLTAISGTSLLTCADNRFIDDSTNNFTITASGSPSVQRFNPFGTATAYSTATIGGSGYFSGKTTSPDTNLSVADVAALQLGGSDFTIECWVYPTGTNADAVIVGKSTVSGSYGDWCFYCSNNSVAFYGQSTSGWNFGNVNIGITPKFAWSHLAVTRSGSNLRSFFNGVLVATTTVSSSIGNKGSQTTIGGGLTAAQGGERDLSWEGYISNLRIVKGTAVYTSTFTPPTAPVTAITNTSLLTNFTNGAIFDNAMMNDLETVGNARISTSVVKYGTGSMFFDGTGDYLIGATNPNMSFNVGDFTTEAWVYRTASPGNNQTIFQKGRTGDSDLEFVMALSGSNFLTCFYTTDGTTANQPFSSTTAVALNTWTHIAITRSGSTWRCFVNGTLEATTTAAVTLYTGTGKISSGANPIGDNPLTGYIDELRITKGYARYTANFTPPTAAFLNIGPY